MASSKNLAARPLKPSVGRPETPEGAKRFTEDLKNVEQLPARTKELLALKDQAEKSTGRENVAVNTKIRRRSGS